MELASFWADMRTCKNRKRNKSSCYNRISFPYACLILYFDTGFSSIRQVYTAATAICCPTLTSLLLFYSFSLLFIICHFLFLFNQVYTFHSVKFCHLIPALSLGL
jgi:hypothetical protein